MSLERADWIAVDWTQQKFVFWHMAGAKRQTVLHEEPAAAPTKTLLQTGLRLAQESHAGAASWPVVTTDLAESTPQQVPFKPSDSSPDRHASHISLTAIAQQTPFTLSLGAHAAIAGFIAENPKFDGILVLPGETTLWAHVSAEEIVSMRSAANLSSTAPLSAPSAALDDSAFDEALQNCLSRPETLAQQLGSARALALSGETQRAQALALGASLGAELAATRAYWLGQAVALIAAEDEAAAYQKAFDSQFIVYQNADRAQMACAGLFQTLQAHTR